MSTPTKLSPRHQQQFIEMLPLITQTAHAAFQDRDTEARRELVAEAVAAALVMFAALVHRGRDSIAYATPLAKYGVARVRDGRRTGSPMNVNDVASGYCQQRHGVKLERLDQRNGNGDMWREIVVEDRNAGPAEIAATRMDFAAWLKSLSRRDRRIAKILATGESTGGAAKKFGISAARISQLRRELQRSWREFVGEMTEDQPAAAAA